MSFFLKRGKKVFDTMDLASSSNTDPFFLVCPSLLLFRMRDTHRHREALSDIGLGPFRGRIGGEPRPRQGCFRKKASAQKKARRSDVSRSSLSACRLGVEGTYVPKWPRGFLVLDVLRGTGEVEKVRWLLVRPRCEAVSFKVVQFKRGGQNRKMKSERSSGAKDLTSSPRAASKKRKEHSSSFSPPFSTMSSATRAAQLSAQDEDSLLSLQVGFPRWMQSSERGSDEAQCWSAIGFHFFSSIVPHFSSRVSFLKRTRIQGRLRGKEALSVCCAGEEDR